MSNAESLCVEPLRIKSVNDLAFRLGIRKDVLISASKEAGAFYSPFESKSKLPPFSKLQRLQKTRPIDNPVGVVKHIQNQIYRQLLRPIVLPDYIFGGIKGKSVLSNAKRHLRSEVLVTIDIKSFFPSVSNRDVYRIWSQMLECGTEVSKILTKLTTFQRRLPQGAPTSTALANLVVLSLDAPIREFCAANGVCYTCWVDDLAFSGTRAREVIIIAAKALGNAGLKLSRRKVKIMPAHSRQILMGIVVNKQIGVTKAFQRATRSGIHKLKSGLVPSELNDKYTRSIRGRIAYARQINLKRAEQLGIQLSSIKRKTFKSSRAVIPLPQNQ